MYTSISDANGDLSLGSLLSKLNKSINFERSNSILKRCYPNWKENSVEFNQLFPLLQQTCGFLDSLYQNVGSMRKSAWTNDRIKVLIVGGGPVGLMSAVESFQNGADVEVVEKRR